MKATRQDVEDWLNPSAWDDASEAQRVLDDIMESGSDDEADWVRIAGGDGADISRAADLAFDRVEHGLSEPLSAYRAAEAAMDAAREALYQAIRLEHARGSSAYRIAQVTGIAERHVGRIVQRRDPRDLTG